MKKLITLSLIALFAVGNLMAFDMNWNGEARVRGGMIMNDNFSDKNHTTTWKAQRIRLFWTGEADNGVKFVVRSHLSNGDVNVGTSGTLDSDGKSVTITSSKKSIDLDRAYIVVPDAFLGVTITAGLMPFYACNGLVIDDNFSGIYFNKAMGDVSVGFGGFTTSEGVSDQSSGSSYTYGYPLKSSNADGDAHALMVDLSMNNAGPGTAGLDVIANANYTYSDNHSRGNLIWISPWYSMSVGDFSVNVNPVILTGSFDVKEGVTKTDAIKDVSGTVMALIVKPSFTLAATGTSLAADFLYIQGKKSTDTDKLGWKKIGPFYCSGLEYFGSANEIDHYGDIGNGIYGKTDFGQMSFIVKADQPLNSALTLHAAAGQFMTAEDVTLTNGKKDNVVGTEIDLGLRWAVKENVTWKFTAAYVMPGDVSAVDGDAITALSTYLGYSF